MSSPPRCTGALSVRGAKPVLLCGRCRSLVGSSVRSLFVALSFTPRRFIVRVLDLGLRTASGFSDAVCLVWFRTLANVVKYVTRSRNGLRDFDWSGVGVGVRCWASGAYEELSRARHFCGWMSSERTGAGCAVRRSDTGAKHCPEPPTPVRCPVVGF